MLDTFRSGALADAITAANANLTADTIELSAGCSYTLTVVQSGSGNDANGLPAIQSDITIDGHGSTIARATAPGTPEFRILRVAVTGTLRLNDTTILNGKAASGGGLYSSGTVTITGSTLTGNAADAFQTEGGAIHNEGGLLTVVDSTISDNHASSEWSYGGGIFNRSGHVIIANSTFSGNSANSASAAEGGGIYSYGGTLQISTCIFDNNRASGNSNAVGGGIRMLTGNLVLTDTTVISNSAGQGGGVYSSSADPMLLRVTFDGNNATQNGGGMFVSYGQAALTNVVFRGNTSGANGGGVYSLSGGTVYVNVVFSGNSASSGGAIANFGSHPSLINTTVSSNTAVSLGGGMFGDLSGSAPTAATIENCIFAHNVDSGGTDASAQIHNVDSSTAVISFTLIEDCGGSGASWDADIGTDGGGNLESDPHFVDWSGPDGVAGTADDDLRLGMGRRAREIAETERSWAAMADRMLELYERRCVC